MKKSMIALFTVVVMATGCGSSANTVVFETTDIASESASQAGETLENESGDAIAESKIETEADDEKTVDIVLRMVNMNNETPEEYVASLSESNPDGKYSVYNDEYYSMTITEKERKEALKGLADKAEIDKVFNKFFTMEEYNGTFVKMDYDDKFQHFTFYVDRQKYEDNKFFCNMGIGLLLVSVSDSAQAYNLVEPEDRISEFQMIDNETNEVIYDSSQAED